MSINDFFSGLWQAFTGYVYAGTNSPLFADWVFLILPLVTAWALVSIALKFQKTSKDKGRVFQIYTQWVVVGYVVALGFLIYFLVKWGQGYYKTSNAEFWHLLSFMVAMLIPLVSFIQLRGHFTRDKIGDLERQPLTILEKEKQSSLVRKSFNKLKMAIPIVLLGFLVLPFLKNPHNLISIVIDNSSSMSEPLDRGKQALANTVKSLDERTSFIVSHFPDLDGRENYNSDVSKLLGTSSSSSLKGVSAYYQNKEAVIEGIQQIQVLQNQTSFSPVLETVMHNKLRTKEEVDALANVKNFKNIISIVVTDGGENVVEDGEETMFCQESSYKDDFFTEVFFIDIAKTSGGGISGGLFSDIQDCDYEILAGAAVDSYEESLEEILLNYTKDWFYVIWLAIICCLFALIALIIQPKKLY